ncbi:MAG TPA: biotin/lipoyl-binding protein [Anaerolineae bacterium]|nr:biotin/lipoyl-binding protein [Anaerolineae bacterium]
MKKLRVTLNGVSYDVEVEVLEDDDEGGAAYGYTMSAVPPMPQPAMMPPSVGAAPVAAPKPAAPAAPVSNGGGNELTSPLAGVVHKINVSVGDAVKENQPVVVIEAMKMNTNINAPAVGKVKEIKVKAGDPVQQGQVLMVFE